MTQAPRALPRIGVVGLGSMGRPMARNLHDSGYAVCGFDILPAAMAECARLGIETCSSPAELALRSDLILLMVWDDASLREAVFGPNGLLAAERLSDCVVDLSTTSVAIALEVGTAFAERGGSFLDAAVIGGGASAMAARTSPMVIAGERATWERYRPVFDALGTCDYVGALGNAKAVKLINNFIVGVVTAANGEALALGLALGLDLRGMMTALRQSAANARVLDSYMGRYLESGAYGDGLIGHKLMAKDLDLAAEFAVSVRCPSLLPRFGRDTYLEFARALGPDRPFPSAFEYFRDFGTAGRGPHSAGAHSPA